MIGMETLRTFKRKKNLERIIKSRGRKTGSLVLRGRILKKETSLGVGYEGNPRGTGVSYKTSKAIQQSQTSNPQLGPISAVTELYNGEEDEVLRDRKKAGCRGGRSSCFGCGDDWGSWGHGGLQSEKSRRV